MDNLTRNSSSERNNSDMNGRYFNNGLYAQASVHLATENYLVDTRATVTQQWQVPNPSPILTGGPVATTETSFGSPTFSLVTDLLHGSQSLEPSPPPRKRQRRISSNALNDEFNGSASAVNAGISHGSPTFSVVKDLIHGSQSLAPSPPPRKRQSRISSKDLDELINGSAPAVNNLAPSTGPHFSCLSDLIVSNRSHRLSSFLKEVHEISQDVCVEKLVDEIIEEVCAKETDVSNAVLASIPEEINDEAIDDDNIQFIKEVNPKKKIDVIDISSDEEKDSTTSIVSTEENVGFKVKAEVEDEDVLMIEPPMKVSQRADLGNP